MIRHSFALRTALSAAGLVLVLSLLGAGWVWRQGEAELRAQLDFTLAAEAEALVREAETLGLAGLVEQARSFGRRGSPLLVALQTVDGAPIAGGLAGASPSLLRGFATLRAEGGRGPLRALGALLPTGVNLIVASDLAPVERAAARLAWAPVGAAGLAVAAGLALGFAGARRLESRLANAGEAARGIMDGDLARRLPANPRGDEFDRLAATINLMLARIEALMAAQRQVTENIAHDLRTPLSRLRLRLEAALAAPRSPPADAATMEAALAELDQVLATFRALLRIARADSGAGRAEFQPFDLSALVAGVAEAYGPVAEDAGRQLAAMIAPGLVLSGDAALLRQSLANLLDNALLHGGPHIALRLSAGPVLEVTDDGPGIPAAERQAVQGRFHRLEASRNTPGTGLGLALVAATARLHGGALDILDGPGGQGVTLRLDLRARAG